MIAVVDYHKGNLRSVERGLAGAGADVVVTDEAAAIANADAIVLPGVGAFTDAMGSLDELGLRGVLRDRVRAGVPFLGICLGLHLLFDGGTEHAPEGVPTPGLGLAPGIADALPKCDAAGRAYKIPHVGWNTVDFVSGREDDCSALFAGIESGTYFYFTHSFAAPGSDATIATTEHSIRFPSAVRLSGLPAYGVQFHPEKSSDAGARVLANFVALAAHAQ